MCSKNQKQFILERGLGLLVSQQKTAETLDISLRAVGYLIAKHLLETRRIGRRVLVTRQSIYRLAAGDHPGPIRTRKTNSPIGGTHD